MAFTCGHQLFQLYPALIAFSLMYKCLASTTCPAIEKIEEGDSSTISCTSQTPFADVYWYIGPTSSTDPILWLQSGKKGGAEYTNAHYDITSLGQMVIIDASLDNEANYTFVGYFDDGTSEEANVTVIITMTPKSPCPTITNCPDCKDCHLSINKTGILSCNIYKARPRIQLDWKIESHEKIELIQYQPTMEYNQESDSWNTSVNLAYKATSCDGFAVLWCVATHQNQLKNGSVNALRIFTDSCLQDNDPTHQESSTGLVISLILIIVLVTVAGTTVFLYYQRKKKIARREENQQEDGGTDEPMLVKSDGNEVQEIEEIETAVSQEEENKEDPAEIERKNKESLISGLKKYFKTFCDKIYLPEEHAISADSVYTHFQCLVTTQEGETDQYSSEELLTLDCVENAKSVRLFGKFGYGKTTFAHYLLRQWVKEDENTNILMYIDMKNVSNEDSFFKIIKGVLPDESNITVTEIKNIIRKYNCLLLLDGYDEMAEVTKQGEIADSTNPRNLSNVSSPTNEMDDEDFKITDFYDRCVIDKYTQLSVWMMARDTVPIKFSHPSSFVTVKLIGFSTEQTDDLVDKFCNHYGECYTISKEKEEKDNQENLSSTATVLTDDNPHEFRNNKFGTKIKNRVKQLVGEKEILHEFSKNPFFLTAISFVIANDVTNKDYSKGQPVDKIEPPQRMKLTQVIGKLITFIELKCLNDSNDSGCKDAVTNMKEQLGKFASKKNTDQYQSMKHDDVIKMIGGDCMKLASHVNLIGIKERTKDIIEFSYRTLENYLAASYCSTREDSKSLSVLMKDDRDDKTDMIYQFLCGLNSSLTSKMLEHFIKNKMFNSFIDCLYEVIDPGKLKLFRSSLLDCNELLEMTIFHRNSYHREALRNFCNFCIKWEVKLQALTLEGDFPASCLKSLTLPHVKQLELTSADLKTEANFDDITEWLTMQNKPSLCRFTDCLLPDIFSDKSLKHIEYLTKKNCKVERMHENVKSKPDSSSRGWKTTTGLFKK